MKYFSLKFRLVFLIVFLINIQGDLFSKTLYRTTTELNVRLKAGTKYPVVFTLARGAEVEVLAKNRGWYHINNNGRTGYVSAKHLQVIELNQEKDSESEKSGDSTILAMFYFTALIILCWWIYRKMRKQRSRKTISTYIRGTSSEVRLVSSLLQFGIPKEHIFHDLYLVKNQSEYAQTDIVVLTQVGLVVIEVKEYSGWIFGNGSQTQWTQVMAYGKQKYYFYNPILQNKNHIAELKKHLFQFDDIPYYSLIVFYGDCEFKSINYVPPGTLIVKASRVSEALRDIFNQNPAYVYKDKDAVIRMLNDAVVRGTDRSIQQQHIDNIKDKLGSDRIYD